MMIVTALCALVGLAGPVEVSLDRDGLSLVRGDRFTVESRIVNAGTAPTGPVKAHLNVASLTGDVSVDPEDWSTSPIRDLPALAPGESTALSWDLKAGDVGDFAVYVVLLPVEPSGPVVVSTPMRVAASGRNTLDAGGTLPTVVAIPVLLGVVAGAARWRIRRVR